MLALSVWPLRLGWLSPSQLCELFVSGHRQIDRQMDRQIDLAECHRLCRLLGRTPRQLLLRPLLRAGLPTGSSAARFVRQSKP